MGRRKGSLNKSTLAKMGLDKYKITPIIKPNPPTTKSKRHRRTKEELIAAGYYKNNNDKEQNKIANIPIQTDEDKPQKRKRRTKAQLIADGYYGDNKKEKKTVDNSNYFVSHSLSIEEVSEQQIEKAKEKGLENWEQDFRNDYESGQRIYYVEINPLCRTKEVLELYVGTVYAKTMIAWVEKGEAHPISMEDADKIFHTEKEAKKYYSKVRL